MHMNYWNQWDDVNQSDINGLPDDLEDYSDLSSESQEPVFPVSLDSLGMSWRDFF